MTALLPDADPANWVDRFAPPSLRPWLKLGRFDRPSGIWLLMLPGWQGVALAASYQGTGPDLVMLAKIAFGAALMRAAGCAYNDIVDRDLDAKVARTAARPVASGQISVVQAWVYVVSLSLSAALILFSLNRLAIMLGLGSLGLVAAYPFMKRITWWPQVWLGLTFNWGVLLGYAATEGNLNLPALVLYLASVFWTLGYDTIYAVQDLEDDALAGIKSSARRLGQATPRMVAVSYILAGSLAVAAAWLGQLGPFFLGPALIYMYLLSRQVSQLNLDDGALALALFKSNGHAGAFLFLALVAGQWGG